MAATWSLTWKNVIRRKEGQTTNSTVMNVMPMAGATFNKFGTIPLYIAVTPISSSEKKGGVGACSPPQNRTLKKPSFLNIVTIASMKPEYLRRDCSSNTRKWRGTYSASAGSAGHWVSVWLSQTDRRLDNKKTLMWRGKKEGYYLGQSYQFVHM